MARININLPQSFSFVTRVPIRITDLNFGGHVGNDAFLSIIHEARVQYLGYHGFDELHLQGTGLIMSDASIVFKNEIFYGDTVTVSVIAAEFSKIGFDLFYKLEKKTDAGAVLVAKARTGMVCFNYGARKIVALPVGVRDKLVGDRG